MLQAALKTVIDFHLHVISMTFFNTACTVLKMLLLMVLDLFTTRQSQFRERDKYQKITASLLNSFDYLAASYVGAAFIIIIIISLVYLFR